MKRNAPLLRTKQAICYFIADLLLLIYRYFERADNFIYLGSLMTGDNSVSQEITNHLVAANRSYFGLKSQFKPQLLPRKTNKFL
jgi:hypothetical protein